MSANPDMELRSVSLTASTNVLRAQQMFTQKLERRTRSAMGAPYGKKLIIHADDIGSGVSIGGIECVEMFRYFLFK